MSGMPSDVKNHFYVIYSKRIKYKVVRNQKKQEVIDISNKELLMKLHEKEGMRVKVKGQNRIEMNM